MNATEARGSERMPWRWLVALLPLVLLAHEAHEFAHTLTGRLVCGRWAERDFSRWSIEGCDSWVPTAIGPLFSYLLMAAGMLLALRAGARWRWPAVALIFAANPLARMVTVASGHGDEMLVVRVWAATGGGAWGPRVAMAVIVVAFCLAVLAVAWRALRDQARRPAVFVLGLLAGIALTGPLLPLFNRWLGAGILSGPVAGAPLLVHLVTLASAAGVLASLPWLVRPLPGESGARRVGRRSPATG